MDDLASRLSPRAKERAERVGVCREEAGCGSKQGKGWESVGRGQGVGVNRKKVGGGNRRCRATPGTFDFL